MRGHKLMEAECAKSLFLTAGFAVISLVVRYGLHRYLFGPALLYWASWIVLTGCGTLSEMTGYLPFPVPDGTFQLILLLHVAALAAFLLGDVLLLAFAPTLRLNDLRNINCEGHLVYAWERVIGGILFTAGSLLLVERILTLSVSPTEFYHATRLELFLTQESTLGRVCAHVINTVTPLLTVAFAIVDVRRGITLKRLLVLTLYWTPWGVALAFRTFLVLPVMQYVLNLFLLRSLIGEKLLPRKDLRVLLLFLTVALTLFVVLGFVRSNPDEPGSEFGIDQFMQPITYVAKTMSAIEPMSDWAERVFQDRILGWSFGLSFFYMVSDRLGFSTYRTDKDQAVLSEIDYLRQSGESYFCIPPSTIPWMIADAGPHLWPYYAFFCLFVLTIIGNLRPKGFVSMMLITLALKAMADSTQVMAGFSVGVINGYIASTAIVFCLKMFSRLDITGAETWENDSS